jgi:Tol biopolymer transport system component
MDHLIDFRSIVREDAVALSPSGRYLAYTLRLEKKSKFRHIEWFGSGAPRIADSAQLWVTDLYEKRSFAPHAEDARSWSGAWSPAEDRLAFLSDKEGVAQLWLWEAENDDVSRLSDVPFFSATSSPPLQWSLDGKRIFAAVFQGDWTPGKEVWRVPLPRLGETSPDELTVEVFRSPDQGGRFFTDAQLEHNLPDLAVLDLASGEVQRILSSTSLDIFVASPDGNYVAIQGIAEFSAEGERNSSLRIIPAYGGAPRVLSEALTFGRGGRHEPVWAPNSDWIGRRQNRNSL